MHYRRGQWPMLDGSLLTDMVIRMRLRAAGFTDMTPECAGGQGDVETDAALIGLGVSGVVRSVCAGGALKHRWWRFADAGRRVVALTEHELVILNTSPRSRSRQRGVDVLAVSRAHLTSLSAAGSSLCVHAGAAHAVTVGHSFARQIVGELAGLVDQCQFQSCGSVPVYQHPRPTTTRGRIVAYERAENGLGRPDSRGRGAQTTEESAALANDIDAANPVSGDADVEG